MPARLRRLKDLLERLEKKRWPVPTSTKAEFDRLWLEWRGSFELFPKTYEGKPKAR